MSYSGLNYWNCFSRLSPIFASEPEKIGNITTVGILSERWKRGNKITVFPIWLWILSSQVWTFLQSIDGRGGCWLSGKLWGAAPQRLGAHSEWAHSPPGRRPLHSLRSSTSKATIRTRWGRSYTSKPANAATKSEQRSFTGKLLCNCN